MIRIDGASSISAIDRVSTIDRRADFAGQLRDAANRRATTLAPTRSDRNATAERDDDPPPPERDTHRDDARTGRDDTRLEVSSRRDARTDRVGVATRDSRTTRPADRDTATHRDATRASTKATGANRHVATTPAERRAIAANRDDAAPDADASGDDAMQPIAGPTAPTAVIADARRLAGASEISVGAPTAPTATAGSTAIAAADDAAAALPELVPLTPLEQAVHDLLVAVPSHEIVETDVAPEIADAPEPATTPTYTPQRDTITDAPAETAPVVEVRTPVELPAPTSHVHLVVGDDTDRVVVTLAVRGNEVNVALRGGDDHTAAALARNAGSLDHAMRTRGLDLASFAAEPDAESPRKNHHHREREPSRDAPFALEDQP
jgi:hypothetical protein